MFPRFSSDSSIPLSLFILNFHHAVHLNQGNQTAKELKRKTVSSATHAYLKIGAPIVIIRFIGIFMPQHNPTQKDEGPWSSIISVFPQICTVSAFRFRSIPLSHFDFSLSHLQPPNSRQAFKCGFRFRLKNGMATKTRTGCHFDIWLRY